LSTTFHDATTAALRIPYSQSHYSWRPVAGQLVIFPGSLIHEIALLKAPEELILITARLRFVGAGQEGYSRW